MGVFQHRSGVIAAVVAALFALAASPAATAHKPGPVAYVAFGSHGGVETAVETIPGPGDGAVETSNLPSSATQATIDIAPKNPSDSIKNFDDMTAAVVSAFPKFAKLNQTAQRIVTCAILSALAGTGLYNNEGDIDPRFDEKDSTLQLVILDSCLKIALALSASSPTGTAHDSAAAACRRAERSISIRLTHTSSGYHGQTVGKTRKAKGRTPLVVSCRHMGKGLRLAIRPGARGRTLLQVAGPNLGVAYVNPGTQPVGVRTTFTVR
jgi:hypothetical protein